MKMRIILLATIALAGMTGASFAVEGNLARRLQDVATPISCDVRAMHTDKQAACAAACDDQFIRDKQKLSLDLTKANSDKTACDAKCGCEQNSR